MGNRTLLIIIQKIICQGIYSFLTLVISPSSKRVTFVSNRSSYLEGNLKAVYESLKAADADIDIKILTRKYNKSFKGKFNYLLYFIRFYYLMAKSTTVLIDDYLLPLYLIKKKKNTKVIQLWHAAGAFKKFGYSALNKKFGPSESYIKHVPIHSNYDYAIVSSPEVIPHFSEAFNLNSKKILPYGLPRTDILFDENFLKHTKENFLKARPDLSGKKIILYAPTFRGESHSSVNNNIQLDIAEMKKILGKDYFLIVHLHPYLNGLKVINKKDEDFAGLFNGKLSILESMVISDLMISDYSSVIFEYSLLKKPIVFLANDLKSYIQERDFYYDFESFIPGPLFRNTADLAYWIKKGAYNREKLVEFSDRFFKYKDGNSSKRIVDNIIL